MFCSQKYQITTNRENKCLLLHSFDKKSSKDNQHNKNYNVFNYSNEDKSKKDKVTEYTKFNFEDIFDQPSSQAGIFQKVVKPIIDRYFCQLFFMEFFYFDTNSSFLSGYNCSLFVYGQVSLKK